MAVSIGAQASDARRETPRLEARENLYHYLFWNPEARKDPARVRNLLEDYRWKRGEKAVAAVKDAPFPRLLLALLLQDKELYASLYTAQYNELTSAPPLEALYDAFLGLRISGDLPASIREEAEALTVDMAKRAQRAKSESCKLEGVKKPSILKLVKLKADVFGMVKPCEYRKIIFGAIKSKLVQVQKALGALQAWRKNPPAEWAGPGPVMNAIADPCLIVAKAEKTEAEKKLADEHALACGVVAEVNRDFGNLFKDGLASSLDSLSRKLPKLFVKKFGGGNHPIWSEIGSIIDPVEDQAIDEQGQIVQLSSFARGFRVDLAAAQVLMHSRSSSDRALAAGLFYAAMNRLILFLGGDIVQLDGEGRLATLNNASEQARELEPAPLDERGLLKPIYSKVVDEKGNLVSETLLVKPLVFQTVKFGGFGVDRVEKNSGKALSMSPWDPIAYDPDAEDEKLRTPFRLIPTRLRLNYQGLGEIVDPVRDLVQQNRDLAEMVLAIVDFMRETKPSGAFGKFFGPVSEIGKLEDLRSSMLVPDLGRLLPLAVLGVFAQNALHPDLGHLKVLTTGLRLAFQDEATFDTVESEDISTEGVAKVLDACHDLREALRHDPILERKEVAPLKEDSKRLADVLQLGVLIVGAKAQNGDTGEFYDHFYSEKKEHHLETQIAMLSVVLKAYNRDPAALTRVTIKIGLEFLVSEIQGKRADELTRDQLFQLSQLWKLIQIRFRQDWPDLAWQEWESLFRSLERELERG